jgi:hypothetical protein
MSTHSDIGIVSKARFEEGYNLDAALQYAGNILIFRKAIIALANARQLGQADWANEKMRLFRNAIIARAIARQGGHADWANQEVKNQTKVKHLLECYELMGQPIDPNDHTLIEIVMM